VWVCFCRASQVDSSSCWAAVLERILLDDAGDIRPQYNHITETGDNIYVETANPSSGSSSTIPGQQHNIAVDPHNGQQADESVANHANAVEQETNGFNTLKRKRSHAYLENLLLDLDDVNTSQYLPPKPTLYKLVDFFCTSFHHWIPFVNKQRLRTRVCEGIHDAGFDLFLHALVAVTMRHLKPDVIFLQHHQIEKHIQISRFVVETKSVQDVSVDSLQALILIVFDHVSTLNFYDASRRRKRPILTANSSIVGDLGRHGH
jgi:hypothetical protein